MEEVVFWILGGVCALLGLLTVIVWLSALLKCKTKVEAEITHFEVRKFTVRGSTVKRYTPCVTYHVDGKTYSGKAEQDTAKEKQYAKGQKITIRIDPKHPENFKFGSYAGKLALGICLIAAGVGMMVIAGM